MPTTIGTPSSEAKAYRERLEFAEKLVREKAVAKDRLYDLADKEARKLAKSYTRYAHFPILEAMRNFDGMSKEEFDSFQVLEALSEE